MNQEAEILEGVLTTLLEAKNPTIERLPEKRHPLFLLVDVAPDLVGFASIDGKPEQDYREALEAFQNLYADFETNWPEHDLSLVLCTHHKPTESADWNSVELDKYFCRKFVIDFSENLDEQIKHLPFVPLSPAAVGLARPLSAQTLLMKKHGLATVLAKALAVSGQGPEGIVDRCLKGQMGEPGLKELPIDEFVVPPTRVGPRVSLSELHIENFRAYKTQTLGFDYDMIVLYGPNGLGKTSLFDALDFLCTGGVWRFDERFGKEKEASLVEVLTHIGSVSSQALVKATASIGPTPFRIERRVSNLNYPLIDGQETDRKATLTKLAGLSRGNKMDLRIENFVRLFRASHFFGQDSSSLTSDVRDKSVLREETVSRMLAFQDYVEALNKSKKVISELNTRANGQATESESFLAIIKDCQLELRRLKRDQTALEAPESVLTRGRDLAARMKRQGHVEIEVPPEIDSSTVQGWRASVEEELHRLGIQLERLVTAQGKLSRRKDLHGVEANLTSVLESKSQTLAIQRQSYSTNKSLLQELQTNCEQLARQEAELSNRSEAVQWLCDNLAEYERLKSELSTNERELEGVKLTLVQVDADLKGFGFQADLIEERVEELRRDIQSNETELSAINLFLSEVSEWRIELAKQKELLQRVTTTEQEHAAASEYLRIARSALNTAMSDKDSSQQRVTSLQQVQTELQTILDSIVPHVSTEVCPVCGTSHRSRDELLSKIAQMRGTQSETLVNELATLDRQRASVDGCQQAVAEKERLLAAIQLELKNEKAELRASNSVVNNYLEAALALRIASDPTPDSYERDGKVKASELSALLARSRQEMTTQLAEAEELRKRISLESEHRRTKSVSLSDYESQHQLLAYSATIIEEQARERGLDLSKTAEASQRERDTIADRLGKVEASKLKNLEEVETQKAAVDSGEHEVISLDAEIAEGQTQLEQSRQALKGIHDLLISADLQPDAADRDVERFRDQLEARRTTLGELRDEVISFEIAMDAAQTHANLARLESDINRHQAAKQRADDKLRTLRVWQVYFEQVHEALGMVQHRLLSEYITKYGPLASMIQERLRAVYGFKGIHLRARKGEIEVTVEKAGREYAPNNYFSESQMQIVMLSLFLSAVLTQTWSSFGPVLLDDPVTHFDDLNSYAFLDVLRGLIDEPEQPHQFIISTCEERLYRLMKQRLPKARGTVAFYEFLSIGEDGPVIREG